MRSEAAWTTYVPTGGPPRRRLVPPRLGALARSVGVTVSFGVSAAAVPTYLVAVDVAAHGYRDDGGWAHFHSFDDALMIPMGAIAVPLLTTSAWLWRWGHGWWALLLTCLTVEVTPCTHS